MLSPQPSPGLGAEICPRLLEMMEASLPPPHGRGGESTQGEPLPEGHASSSAQAEEVFIESSVTEMVQKATKPTPAEDEACDPATTTAGEMEAPARQTSPCILLSSSFLPCFDCFL